MPTILVKDISEIHKAAREILKLSGENKILAFYGELGAGKTTLIKSICEQLNIRDVASSPTFSLINEYSLPDTKEKVYHFDFYRINNLEEIYDFGYEEYFYSNNYCFIEWPEKIEPLLPGNSIKIKIEILSENKRKITLPENQ